MKPLVIPSQELANHSLFISGYLRFKMRKTILNIESQAILKLAVEYLVQKARINRHAQISVLVKKGLNIIK